MRTETSGRLVPISTAAALFPGRRVHLATIWRWAQRGVRGIKLETVAIGGRRYVSPEAVERFIAATTAAAEVRDAQ